MRKRKEQHDRWLAHLAESRAYVDKELHHINSLTDDQVAQAEAKLDQKINKLPVFSGLEAKCPYCWVKQIPISKLGREQAIWGVLDEVSLRGGRGKWREFLSRECRVCAHRWHEQMPPKDDREESE